MSSATSRVVILDCCFSGRAIEAQTEVHSAVVGQIGIEGTYILTSAPRNETSLAPVGSAFTSFTGELVTILRDGISEGPDVLTMDTIYEELNRRMRAKGLPIPEASRTRTAHRLGMIRNAVNVPQAPDGDSPSYRRVTEGEPSTTEVTLFAENPWNDLLAVARGISYVSEMIQRTIGPAGRTSLVRNSRGEYAEVGNAAAIARTISPADPRDKLGVQMIRDLVDTVLSATGSGAATAVVLTNAIIGECMQRIEGPGPNSGSIARALESVGDDLVAAVKRITCMPASMKELERVIRAFTHDRDISMVTAEALDLVGPDGSINVVVGLVPGLYIESKEGMSLAAGYASKHFMEDEETSSIVLIKPLILVSAIDMMAVTAWVPLLEEVLALGRTLLVVSSDIMGESLSTLIVNKTRGTLRSVAVRVPGWGSSRDETLGDIALLSGATVFRSIPSADEKPYLSRLGGAERVVITQRETVILDGSGDTSAIRDRMSLLKQQMSEVDGYDREQLQQRYASLAQVLAVIEVKNGTAEQTRVRCEAVDVAIRVARTVVRDGFVPGGGAALLFADSLLATDSYSSAQLEARSILRGALEQPLRHIAVNAGLDPDLALSQLRKNPSSSAFDIRRSHIVDALEGGVVDPEMVVEHALREAIQMAVRFLKLA
jgi:chaperonin GroEL